MQRTSRDVDIELAAYPSPLARSVSRLSGYPSFADFIAADADAAIYRKYEHLSARNILYLQSELHELEGQLDELDSLDVKERELCDEESQKVARYWRHYSGADSARATKHRELQVKIRSKIREYRKWDSTFRQKEMLR